MPFRRFGGVWHEEEGIDRLSYEEGEGFRAAEERAPNANQVPRQKASNTAPAQHRRAKGHGNGKTVAGTATDGERAQLGERVVVKTAIAHPAAQQKLSKRCMLAVRARCGGERQ